MRHGLLSLLAVFMVQHWVISAPTLETEIKTPYLWRIVLHSAPHPAISADFRQTLAKDLIAGLKPNLEEGGKVEVVDLASIPKEKWEPLWKKFHADGWPGIEDENHRMLTGVKTHFLKIDVLEGNTFRLEARQHDGSTGLTSPVLRSKETQSADTIARHAVLLIGKDFGPVGTVLRNPDDPKDIRVHFKAGLIGPYSKWVNDGDILAFAIIFKKSQPLATESKSGQKPAELPPLLGGMPQQYTLLRVKTTLTDGTCKCDLITKFTQPFVGGRDVVGFRCMKLTTQESPLRLRILDADGQPPMVKETLEVWASDAGIVTNPNPRETLQETNGVFRSVGKLRNMACVVVRLGTSKSEVFPIPLFGSDEPTTIRFRVTAEQVAKAEYEQACQRVQFRALDALYAQVELYKGLSVLIQQGQNQKALDRAKAGLNASDGTEKELSEEITRLAKDARADAATKGVLASASEQLQLLRVGRPELAKRVEDLEAAVKKSNDPVAFEREFRMKELTRQIGYHLSRGEAQEALDLYDQLFELTQDEKAKKLKADLANEWAPKSEEHSKARRYLLEVWRKAETLDEIRSGLDELPFVLTRFEAAQDKLGLRNLVASIPFAYAKLKELIERLDENNENDQLKIKKVKEVSEALRKIEEKASEVLKKLDPPK